MSNWTIILGALLFAAWSIGCAVCVPLAAVAGPLLVVLVIYEAVGLRRDDERAGGA